MKFTIAANELSAALAKVQPVSVNRTTLPILETFLIRATGGEVIVTASSIDMEATAKVACDIEREGRAAISSNVASVVKSLGKSLITIDVADDKGARATLTGPRQKYEFGALPADEFPIMMDMGDSGVSTFELDGNTLAAGLGLTRGTASTQETQFYLCGVCVQREGHELVFVATDKTRFSRYAIPTPDGAETMASAIVPTAAVSAIVGVVSGVESVQIAFSRAKVRVDAGSAILTSKLIEGEFIKNYRDYFDRQVRNDGVRVSRAELSEALARIAAIRSDTKVPGFTIRSNGSTIELISDKRSRSEGVEAVDAEILHDTDFGVATGHFSSLIGVWPESATIDIAGPREPGDGITIKSASVPALVQLIGTMRV